MRISDTEERQLTSLAHRYFGRNAKLYLFGSCVDDSRRGGDIDLFVEVEQPVDLEQRIHFLVDAEKNITSRKLDLIVKQPGERDRPIFETAQETGILLC